MKKQHPPLKGSFGAGHTTSIRSFFNHYTKVRQLHQTKKQWRKQKGSLNVVAECKSSLMKTFTLVLIMKTFGSSQTENHAGVWQQRSSSIIFPPAADGASGSQQSNDASMISSSQEWGGHSLRVLFVSTLPPPPPPITQQELSRGPFIQRGGGTTTTTTTRTTTTTTTMTRSGTTPCDVVQQEMQCGGATGSAVPRWSTQHTKSRWRRLRFTSAAQYTHFITPRQKAQWNVCSTLCVCMSPPAEFLQSSVATRPLLMSVVQIIMGLRGRLGRPWKGGFVCFG